MKDIDRIQTFVLQELAPSRRGALAPDEDLLALGLLDSVSIVRLVRYLETTFEIELEDDDVVPERFQSIATIAALVEERRGARQVA